jgi:hypothetical protein
LRQPTRLAKNVGCGCRVAGKILRSSGPLRTVRASFPAYRSSICQRLARPPRGFPSWTAPAVDDDADNVPGGGITTHQNIGGVVLIKVGIEDRPADRAPARLLLEQVSAIEASPFPHQSPKPAIFPVVAQARIEETDFALDLHEAGHSGFVVARKLEPAEIGIHEFKQGDVQGFRGQKTHDDKVQAGQRP